MYVYMCVRLLYTRVVQPFLVCPAVILSSGELCLCGCGVVMLSSLSLLRCSDFSGIGAETTPDTIAKVNVSTLCVYVCVCVCVCCVHVCVRMNKCTCIFILGELIVSRYSN